MKHVKRSRGWSVRPQLGVVLIAAVLLFASLVQMFSTNTPTQVGESPHVAAQRLRVNKTAPHVDCAVTACMVLSFDDGPDATTTPKVLDILEQHNIRATFFVVGSHASAMPDLLRRMYRAGHEVGNHSWGHPDFTKLSPEQIRAEVANTQAAVVAAGLPAPRLFRPPYGAVNATVKSHIPMTIALWNVDPEDWRADDPNVLVQKVITTAKPGGVVAMHDIDAATADALPAILQNLQSRFQLVTMSEMFNLAPGQRGEFFGR